MQADTLWQVMKVTLENAVLEFERQLDNAYNTYYDSTKKQTEKYRDLQVLLAHWGSFLPIKAHHALAIAPSFSPSSPLIPPPSHALAPVCSRRGGEGVNTLC